MIGITCESFVNTVIYYFVYEVMESGDIYIAGLFLTASKPSSIVIADAS